MKVLDFPLTKITFSFVFGILAASFWLPQILSSLLYLFSGFILLSIFYFLSKKNKKLNLFFGLSTYYTSFCIGMIALAINTNSLQNSNYIHFKNAFKEPHHINITIKEKLKSNAYNDRYIGFINCIDTKYYTGRIIINIVRDSIKNSLFAGNSIRVTTVLQHNSLPKNPDQFDYSNYLDNKQIYAQIYVSKAAIVVDKKIRKDIWFYTSSLQARIIHNLEKAKFNTTEMNVALALILGQKQEISSEIKQDYQYSGVTHVLSVSGLHVGFIMLFISFMLKPIPNTKKGSLIKLITIIISLVLFAIVSGLSPPVLRSVVMFSFLATGNHLHRNSNTYHTLLVSILLLLLFEPYFLFDAGFQLSYIALFSILWLQPLLKNSWLPKNKIVKYLWEALTVSFAAQIGTFPICLYYFHQFPALFFVTNILILPVLSFIMIIGIIVMLISVFTSCPLILIQVFEKSIYLLNQIIHYIASFESFVIKNISFNFYHLISFYLFLIASIIWFKKPNYNKFIIVLTTTILVQLSLIQTKKEIESKHELIVYHVKKKTIITERIGRSITLFTSNAASEKQSKNDVLQTYLVANFGVLKSTNKIKNILFFNGKKILLIDSSGIYEKKVKPDILLLTASPKINLDRILEDLQPKIVIADGSNTYSFQQYWKTSCHKKRILFHSTSEKGFYKLN
ncbi:competence protein ComEC [Flavobacterium aquidurense]|uniref:Competence protein ComEC n=1 Tax=Flavobacterium frigidimaris TaxID=262320 RepID=A0ABX4BRJ5_FLAFR|nr:ComEC/Rec2 family competence protein [Flavobacterium frigidimaris]OXA79860.1 competence protein ComEC [Flavobacterium frigidimaris]SDZ39273.1 competence protein ComEC [Flavobacterium aquidurense]